MTVEKSLHPSEKSTITNQVSNREGFSETNSIQKTARFAGLLYLIITVAATIAHFYVPSNIIVPGEQ